jgi:hypothetical protein
MEKLVAEKKKTITIKASNYDRIWYLVNLILAEKGYFVNGVLEGGDLSEELLERIGKVLRERAEKGTGWREDHSWAFGRYRRDFDEA